MSDLPVQSKNIGEQLVRRYEEKFQMALGYELVRGHLSYSNFLVAVAEDVANSEKLSQAFAASPATAMSCLLMAAQCKLIPGSKYQLFYLIPRMMSRKTASGWQKIPEVTYQIGYKGLMEMAKRHPRVHSVTAQVVYEGEEFAFLPGEAKVIHKWRGDVDRSDDKLVAAYARCIITEPESTRAVHDEPIFACMSRSELEKIRSRSEAWKAGEQSWNGNPPRRDSPWHTDFSAMCRKTVLRNLLNGGSVPRDMGIGGVLQNEAEQDMPQMQQAELPKASQVSNVRSMLGIESAEPIAFDFVEDAFLAIDAAATLADLQALTPRWQHFTGSDASELGVRYENRMNELERQ